MKITGLAKKVNRKVTVPTKVESAVPNVPHQPPAGAGTRSVNPAVISQATNCIARTCYRYSSGGPPHKIIGMASLATLQIKSLA